MMMTMMSYSYLLVVLCSVVLSCDGDCPICILLNTIIMTMTIIIIFINTIMTMVPFYLSSSRVGAATRVSSVGGRI
jgi:hypothetical protein